DATLLQGALQLAAGPAEARGAVSGGAMRSRAGTSAFRWGERATSRAVGFSEAMDARLAVLVLAVLLMASWAIGWFAGGENAVPPHWYYIPIALAAVRFGPLGAFVTAVISTVLAGPLLPSDVATMTQQPLSDWTIR